MIKFLIGLFIGSIIGFFTAAAKRGDDYEV